MSTLVYILRLRRRARHAGSELADKLAVMGALSLYLNLINLFQLLLSLFGQREETSEASP